jgi:hypothetical protein
MTEDGLQQVGSCGDPIFTQDSVVVSSAIISNPPGYHSCRMDLVEWMKRSRLFVSYTESSAYGSSTTSWSAIYNTSASVSEIRTGLYVVTNLILNIGGSSNDY